MGIGSDSFNALWDALPDTRCELRFRQRHEINKAISAGLAYSRSSTDEGQANVIDGNVRFLATDEPREHAGPGDVAEIKTIEVDEWTKFRIAERYELGGMVRLTIGGRYV